jgi:hypothetical protein
MAPSYQNFEIASIGLVAVLFGFTVCGAFYRCIFRFCETRGFHVRDFEKLSEEAKLLCNQTAMVSSTIALEDSHRGKEDSIADANQAILAEAYAWDTELGVALAAWEDVMCRGGDADVEMGLIKGSEDRAQMRKKGRKVIRDMREWCFEAIGKRRQLIPQLDVLHLEAAKQYVVFSLIITGRRNC